MRTKTLKGYVKDSLSNYLTQYKNPSFRFNWLLEKSKDDVRLAELSQAYFLLEKREGAEMFNQYSNYLFHDLDDLLNSDNKYVNEYEKYLNSLYEYRGVYRSELKKYVVETKLTMYRVSKLAKTNQSNVTRFFEGDDKALSDEKLQLLVRKLRRYSLLQMRDEKR